MGWETIKRNGNKIDVRDSNKEEYSFIPFNKFNDEEEKLHSFVGITNIDFRNRNTTYICEVSTNKNEVLVNCSVNSFKSIQNNKLNFFVSNLVNYSFNIGFGFVIEKTFYERNTAIGFRIYENGNLVGYIGSRKPLGIIDDLPLYEPYNRWFFDRSNGRFWNYECNMFRTIRPYKDTEIKLQIYTNNTNQEGYKILNSYYTSGSNYVKNKINHRIITFSLFK